MWLCLCAGTYTGAGNNGLTFGTPELRVASLAGAAPTIIDMQGSGRAFTFTDGQSAFTTISGKMAALSDAVLFALFDAVLFLSSDWCTSM